MRREKQTNTSVVYLSTQKKETHIKYIKDPSNCKMSMRGRSNVGPQYRLTALLSGTELIKRCHYNETSTQCCFNVKLTSATLTNIKPAFGKCAVFAGKALTVNMQLFLDPHGNKTICVSTQSPDERIGELFTQRYRSSI